MQVDGFDAEGSCPPIAQGASTAACVAVWQVVSACHRIAMAAETSMLHSHIVTQNLTFAGRQGAVTRKPADS